MKPTHTTYQLRAQALDSKEPPGRPKVPCPPRGAGQAQPGPGGAFWHVLLGVALLFSLLAWTSGARAEEAPTEEFRSELWLDSGFWSHHTKQRKNTTYREQNEGIGLEWRFAPKWQVNAGHYRNSLSQPSNYLQVGWMPLAWRPVGELKFELGASVGVVNGYSGIADGGYFPTLVPVASTEWKRVGVNLVYIPSVGRIHGAYAAQLKFKLF